MLATAAHLALAFAFALTLAQSTFPFWAASRGSLRGIALTRAAAIAQAALVLFAFASLIALFVTNDFSVALVARHSHSSQPLAYRAAAAWGNHEGSLLLWVLILSLFGGALALSRGSIRETFRARALAVQASIAAAFLAFLLFTSDPFARLFPVPPDGMELNPLLQDPGLVGHPPLLYIGYVGFSVAFSFAAAALIEGRVDPAWGRWVRPWVLAAWTSLTAGIALGSFWAYYTLGWGGWWYWDPVENASLMPWLLGTALLHSAVVTEKRGALVAWTILLAVLTFSLSLVGTFLVRSGILTSVHAFAVDPARGVVILAIIVGFTGAAFTLFAVRAPAMRSSALFGAVSRETGLTLNNLGLMALAATVFLGTFWPVVTDVTGGHKISVGPPYYLATFVPIAIPLLLLMPAGPLLAWKRDSLPALARRLAVPALTAIAALAAGIAVLGAGNLLGLAGVALGVWLIAGSAALLWRRFGGTKALSWRLVRTTRPAVWGGALAHAGLGVLVVGIAAMGTWSVERTLRMAPGDRASAGRYSYTFDRLGAVMGPNYIAARGTFTVTGGGRTRTLVSERRLYLVSGTRTTVAGIGGSVAGNAYVAIGEPQPGDPRVVVRIYDHPLAGWLWAGAGLMALGGGLALADRRFRRGAVGVHGMPVDGARVVAPALVPHASTGSA